MSDTKCVVVGLALLLCHLSGAVAAEAVFDVRLGQTRQFTMKTNRPLRQVTLADEGIVKLKRLDGATAVALTGLNEGSTRAVLTDVDGAVEAVELVSWNDKLRVGVGSTVLVRMPTRRPIKTVIVERESVIRVQPVATDPTAVSVTGLTLGSSRLTLIDVDGRADVFEPERK